MSTVRLDDMRKLEVPGGEPGQLFTIEQERPGRFVIERMDEPAKHTTIEEVEAAMRAHPLTPRMSWEELRAMTREI